MVRVAEQNDLKILANLAVQMWKHHSEKEIKAEFSYIMAKPETRFFLKYEKEIPVGFAQCQLRHDYVENTKTKPVGYLEGIFVKEAYRGRGYAKELLTTCEIWAKERGCSEFASDCELDNTESFYFHRAMNFLEANRIICFTKAL